MSAAVDTNVLLPVLRGDGASASVLVPFLDRFIGSVGLVVSGPVYAELADAPGMQVASLDRFLAAEIGVEVDLARDVWLFAAASYRSYAGRRQASGVGWPRCILADFLIGAHAQLRVDLLLTFDALDLGRMLPDLEVVIPPSAGAPWASKSAP